ncbi:hypothetical protein GALMADRAFT_231840 [Galerina marginata CBS 339.88]|uniref:Uncharacterized protein n=1 Tax=Galerina marginata (strain CBS 339.88) TaxID=685588 RepID=A0A067S9T2_GALM3|nr:hypothetical protein GALMADRAFT_231840 [Galerina marginata CBS 339.88]
MIAGVAFKLLEAMSKSYTSHSERLKGFKEFLILIFPDDIDCDWHQLDGSSSSSMVLQHRQSLAPVLMVDVSMEFGPGGEDPFYQNGRHYQMIVDGNQAVRECGAPVFLLQLYGNFLGVGGGFCDTKDGPPITQKFGGHIHLEPGFGGNVDQTARTLYAIKEALPLLLSTTLDKFIPGLPRIYPSHIHPLEVISPGRVFKAIVYPQHQPTLSEILESQQAQVERLQQQLDQAIERLARTEQAMLYDAET